MKVRTDGLHWQDRRSVGKCRECYRHGDGTASLCGWHENVVAAARIVEATAGTIEREGLDR